MATNCVKWQQIRNWFVSLLNKTGFCYWTIPQQEPKPAGQEEVLPADMVVRQLEETYTIVA
jgi:hypothetical protein